MSNLKGKKHIGTYDNLGEGYFLSDQLNVLTIEPRYDVIFSRYFLVYYIFSPSCVHEIRNSKQSFVQ